MPTTTVDVMTIAERVMNGDERAIARAISLIENEAPEGADLVRALFARSGRGRLVGVTGAPGVGKSTLVDRMTSDLRRRARTVGVVAVDPTSPFSGGAILGDRIRMQSHAGDAGVFMRSMATRGHLGGLARATADAALVLAASSKDVVIIETIGVGQDEVDIARTADVSLVVVAPGAGDEVQALKAGIMEIADVFVVNKADREGADRTASEIEAMLSLQDYGPGAWRPPVVKTQAASGEGVPAVLEAIERFQARAPQAADRRRERMRVRVRELVARRFLARLDRTALGAAALEPLVDRLIEGSVDPYTAADQILERALGRG